MKLCTKLKLIIITTSHFLFYIDVYAQLYLNFYENIFLVMNNNLSKKNHIKTLFPKSLPIKVDYSLCV